MIRSGFFTRTALYRMLEGTPTHPGRRAVRIALAGLILLNLAAVIAESIESVGARHASAFHLFEILSVIVFSIEYLIRVWVCVEDPRFAGPGGRLKFALSPMALVDLVAILPFFLGALVPVDTRILRALRLLRILKLSRHSSSMDLLLTVIRQEASSILSSMFVMLIVIVIAATGIYMIEREAQPEAFGSIPKAMWWASVTLTTVGYGDVVPLTVPGKLFGFLITITGVGMVALPAGILASGFSLELQRRRETFRLQVTEALDDDGAISRSEKVQLEFRRDELGLSKEDANLVMSAEYADRGPITCPRCGNRFSDKDAARPDPRSGPRP